MAWLAAPVQRSPRQKSLQPNERVWSVEERTVELPAVLPSSPTREVNDTTAMRVLNAASRPSLNLDHTRPSYRVQPNGDVKWASDHTTRSGPGIPKRMTCAQAIVADISYLADRPGHGLNGTSSSNSSPRRRSAPRRLSAPTSPRSSSGPLASVRFSADSLASPPRGAKSARNVAGHHVALRAMEEEAGDVLSGAARGPSSRAAAIRTAKQLHETLEALGQGEGYEEEIAAWDAALADVTRQVDIDLYASLLFVYLYLYICISMSLFIYIYLCR